MPELKEYVNKENIQPTDRGTEAFVQQGRRIGAASNQVAESLRDFGNRTGQNIGSAIRDAGDAAVQYQQHREISQGVGSYALLQDSLITRWNDTAKNADPNDPTVRQKFVEGTLTPELQKWADAFQTEGGQKWAMERQRALLDHMYEKTTADMGTLAAQAVSNNLRTFGNTLANTAANDPSSVPHLLKEADAGVGAMVDSSPNLKGVAAGRAKMELGEKIKEGIVKSGAQSAIKKSTDPEAEADKQRQMYPQYITPDEGNTLGQNARTVNRARDYDTRTAAAVKKQEDTERSNEAVAGYLTDISSKNPRIVNDPVAQKILNDPNLTKTDRRNLLNYVERELKPETDTRISAQTFNGLLRDLRQPNADASAIMQKAWDARLTDAGKSGSLTQPDFDRVRKEIEDRKTPEGMALAQDREEFFKRYERTIDPQINAEGTHTPLGDQKIYQARRDARQMEAQLRAQGKDPHSLYDPNSPNFFGRQITGYRPTLQEQTDFKAQEARDTKVQPGALPAANEPSWWQRTFGGAPTPPTVTSKDEYDKLAPGATFYSNGKPYRKPDKSQDRVPVSQ